MKIAEAWVELRSDDRVARAEVKRQAANLGGTFAQIFGAAAFGAGLKKAIDAGSALEQAVGATEAVFGKNTRTIDAWAKSAARNFGLSEAAARGSLSLIGSQLKNFGFSVEDAQARGQELVALGADLAATFGGTTADAVEAVSAALRGEFDTIERYAVSLGEARVKAKALELGLYSGKGALEQNAKAQAVLSLIVEQTSAAHGQFARELDTVAGKEAVAAAEAENSAASLGQALAPAYERIVEVLGFVAKGFGALPPVMQVALVGLLGVVALAGPFGRLKDVVGTVTTAFGKMSTTGKATAGALGAVGAVLAVAMIAYGQYEEGKRKAAEVTREFVDALEAEAAGQAGATRAAIAAKLASSDLQDRMAAFGVTNQEVADWIEGKTVPALDYLTSAYGKTTMGFKYGDDTFASMRGFKITAQDAALLSQELWSVRDSFGAATLVAQINADVMAEVVDNSDAAIVAASGLTSRNDSLSRAVHDTNLALGAQQQALDDLKKAIDDVFSPYMDAEQANRNLQAAADDLAASLKENGATLDIYSEKGRANRESAQTMAEAILASGAAMVTQGASAEQAAEAISFGTVALRDQLTAAGLTTAQADEYIKTLGLTPENIKTTVELAEYDARRAELLDLLDQLGEIDAGAKAAILADIDNGSFATAEAAIKNVARARDIVLNLVPSGNGGTFRIIRNAMGGYKDHAELGIYGEAGPEAILPLGRPGRLAELLGDPRIGGPVAAAMGANGSGGGGGSSGGGGAVTHVTVPVTIYGAERAYITELVRKIETIKAGG